MQPGKPSASIKPTVDTQFHIDYEWWERENNDLRAYILSQLPTDLRERVEHGDPAKVIDFIDPDTAEVQRLDALGLAIQEASQRPDFINMQTSLVDSVFRIFLANGNQPRTPHELEIDTGRDAKTILKTFGGILVYRGIRPVQTES